MVRTAPPFPRGRSPWEACCLVQLGRHVLGVNDAIGPAGTAWLRLTIGTWLSWPSPGHPCVRCSALTFPSSWASASPPVCRPSPSLPPSSGYLSARPWRSSSSGRFTVAAVRSHSRRALAWPVLAFVGVVLLTEPWHGQINAAGLAFATLAGVGWGCLHAAHPASRRPLLRPQWPLHDGPRGRCHRRSRRHPASGRTPHRPCRHRYRGTGAAASPSCLTPWSCSLCVA